MIKLSNLIIEQILIEDFYSCYDNGILNESKVFDLIKKNLKKGVAVATLISALTAFDYSEAQAQDMVDSVKVQMSIANEVNTAPEVTEYMEENLEELVNLMVGDKEFFENIVKIYSNDSNNTIIYKLFELRLQYGTYIVTIFNTESRDYVTFDSDSPEIKSFEVLGDTQIKISNIGELKKLKQIYPSSKNYRFQMAYQSDANNPQVNLFKMFSNMINSSQSWEYFNQKYSNTTERKLEDRISSIQDIESALNKTPIEFVKFIFLKENSLILNKVMELYSRNESKMNDYLESKILETGMAMALVTDNSGQRVSVQRILTKREFDDLRSKFPTTNYTIEIQNSRSSSEENMAYQKLYNEYMKYAKK